MNIVNLTSHKIEVYNADKELILEIPPSGYIARVEEKHTLLDFIKATELSSHIGFLTWERTPANSVIPIYNKSADLFCQDRKGNRVRLPPQLFNTIYIVSKKFRSYCDREDLYEVGLTFLDENGQLLGCIGLTR